MRKMRKSVERAFVAVTLCLAFALTGCATKDDAAQKVMSELDSLTTDMVKALEASPNDAGITEAVKILREREAGIKEAAKELKAGFVSDEMKTKYDTSIDASFKKFIDFGEKYETQMFSDEKLTERYIAMIEDMKKLFTEE